MNLKKQIEEVQPYTPIKIVCRDVAKEYKEVFDDEDYYQYYLRELEQSHHVVAASDLLRYQILRYEGGIYLDTDLLPKLDIDEIEKRCSKNFPKLLSVYCDGWDIVGFDKKALVINELMKLIFLENNNIENIKKLNQEIENMCQNNNLNIKFLEKVAQELEFLTWENCVYFNLNKSAVFSESEVFFDKTCDKYLGNCFIISKKNAVFWEKLTKMAVSNFKLTKSHPEENLMHVLQSAYNDQYIIGTTGLNLIFSYSYKDDYSWFGNLNSYSSVNSVRSISSTWLTKIELPQNYSDDSNVQFFETQKILISNLNSLNKQIDAFRVKISNNLAEISEIESDVRQFNQDFSFLCSNLKQTVKIGNRKVETILKVKREEFDVLINQFLLSDYHFQTPEITESQLLITRTISDYPDEIKAIQSDFASNVNLKTTIEDYENYFEIANELKLTKNNQSNSVIATTDNIALINTSLTSNSNLNTIFNQEQPVPFFY